MNPQEHLLGMLRYNSWANARFFQHWKQAGEGVWPSKAGLLFSHLINAQAIWNQRIDTSLSAPGVWQNHTLHALEELDDNNHKNSFLLVEQYDLSHPVHYSNSKGKVFHNTLSDIMWHVVNHASYHRGQVAALLSAAALGPPATDYIVYRREA